MNDVQLRPATPADFPAIAALMNAVWPDQFFSVQALETEERNAAAAALPLLGQNSAHEDAWPLKRGRLLAEWGGEVVGVAEYTQYAGMYHPQKFNVGVNVHPAQSGQGVGKAWAERCRRRCIARSRPSTPSASRRAPRKTTRAAWPSWQGRAIRKCCAFSRCG